MSHDCGCGNKVESFQCVKCGADIIPGTGAYSTFKHGDLLVYKCSKCTSN